MEIILHYNKYWTINKFINCVKFKIILTPNYQKCSTPALTSTPAIWVLMTPIPTKIKNKQEKLDFPHMSNNSVSNVHNYFKIQHMIYFFSYLIAALIIHLQIWHKYSFQHFPRLSKIMFFLQKLINTAKRCLSNLCHSIANMYVIWTEKMYVC